MVWQRGRGHCRGIDRGPCRPQPHCAPLRVPPSLSPHHRHWCHRWQIIGFCLSSQLLPSTFQCQGSFPRHLAGAETTKKGGRGDQNEQPAINPPHALHQGAETSLCKAKGVSGATRACCLPTGHCTAHTGAGAGGTTVPAAAGAACPRHGARAKPLRAAPLPHSRSGMHFACSNQITRLTNCKPAQPLVSHQACAWRQNSSSYLQ